MPEYRNIARHLTSLVVCVACFGTIQSRAQKIVLRTVSGQVLDASTGEPLSNAHVFYSGSTIGDISDLEGRFELPSPNLDKVDLVVSIIGYSSHKKQINRLTFDFKPIRIAMVQRVIGLDEVEVIAEVPKSWKRNLKRFEELLFSTTENGKHCEIENPEVLDLFYDDDFEYLTSSASEPLEIINRDLGYRVTVHDLTLEGKERGYQFSGEFLFTELTAKSDKELNKWKERRDKAYQGSMRHFLRALVSNRLKEDKFSAYHVDRAGQEITTTPIAEMHVETLGSGTTYSVVADLSETSKSIFFDGALFVRYEGEKIPVAYRRHLDKHAPRSMIDSNRHYDQGQASWITLPLYSALIDTTGIIFTGMQGFPIAHFGYWAWERFGEMLPTDYVPD